MSASLLILGIALVYVAIGAVVALGFLRAGAPGAAAGAVFAWPLLLGGAGGEPAGGQGPYAREIQRGLRALRAALEEPEAQGLVPAAHVDAIEAALRGADARVRRVDRLLQDADVQASPDGARLRRARGRAAAELEAVLKGLVQLRVQLGLVALAGETAPVREQLDTLAARLHALDELRGVGQPSSAAD